MSPKQPQSAHPINYTHFPNITIHLVFTLSPAVTVMAASSPVALVITADWGGALHMINESQSPYVLY